MGFTWTQTIGQFTQEIEAQDVQELRNNVDWLNNNLECQTHHTYCSGHYTSHLSTYYTPNYGSQCGTYCASVNISYQPYTPCDSLGTCFPAGVKILMYDGRWFSIEDIRPGDIVMSFYGKPNKVLDIYNTILGRNRSMLGFLDDSLVFTPEEALWAKNETEEYWAISDYNKFLAEEDLDYYVNNILYQRYGLKRKQPILQISELEYAHLTGWKKQTPVVRREYYQNTVVYNLIPDGDYTYFVNGYITYGAISDEIIDFTKYKWNGLQVEIQPPFYLSESSMIKRK